MVNTAKKLTAEQQSERERTLAALAGGGSVLAGGRIVSRREDLPADHPARWEEGGGERQGGEGGEDDRLRADTLSLSRIAELETWLKQRDATITALEATANQQAAALDAVKAERDRAQAEAGDLRAALGAANAKIAELTGGDAPKANSGLVQTGDADRLERQSATPTADGSERPADQQKAQQEGQGGQQQPAQVEETSEAGDKLPLDFPRRRVLEDQGITTVAAVKAALSDGSLGKLDNIGERAVDAIRDYLSRMDQSAPAIDAAG